VLKCFFEVKDEDFSTVWVPFYLLSIDTFFVRVAQNFV